MEKCNQLLERFGLAVSFTELKPLEQTESIVAPHCDKFHDLFIGTDFDFELYSEPEMGKWQKII